MRSTFFKQLLLPCISWPRVVKIVQITMAIQFLIITNLIIGSDFYSKVFPLMWGGSSSTLVIS